MPRTNDTGFTYSEIRKFREMYQRARRSHFKDCRTPFSESDGEFRLIRTGFGDHPAFDEESEFGELDFLDYDNDIFVIQRKSDMTFHMFDNSVIRGGPSSYIGECEMSAAPVMHFHVTIKS